jgi:bifunctional DNA-binding transcriptional regulator/antitoxin component of YhaV-PrlF toxin-antitoxin module
MLETTISVKCESDEYGNLILPIPDDLIETLGWQSGDDLEIGAMYNRIVIKRLES